MREAISELCRILKLTPTEDIWKDLNDPGSVLSQVVARMWSSGVCSPSKRSESRHQHKLMSTVSQEHRLG